MPGIYVRVAVEIIFQVLPMTDAHVFDEPRGIEFFGQFPHLLDPFCGGDHLLRLAAGAAFVNGAGCDCGFL